MPRTVRGMPFVRGNCGGDTWQGRMLAIPPGPCYNVDMFAIDDKSLKRYEQKLRELNARGVPHAVRNTLNSTASFSRPIAQNIAEKNLILRNKYTMRSIRFQTAKLGPIPAMYSVLGSDAEYMERVEFGGVITKRGKHGHPIPTTVASGEGEGAKPRRKQVRKPMRLSNINLARQGRPRPKGGTPRQRALIMVRMAKAAKQKYAFLNFDKNPGIYQIKGTKKKPDVKMVYSLREKQVRTPRLPIIKPAADKASEKIPVFWAKSLRFQLNRLRSKNM